MIDVAGVVDMRLMLQMTSSAVRLRPWESSNTSFTCSRVLAVPVLICAG